MSLLDKRTDAARRPAKRALLDFDLGDDAIVIYEHADKNFTVDVGSERCILEPVDFERFVKRIMAIGQRKGWTVDDNAAIPITTDEEETHTATDPARGVDDVASGDGEPAAVHRAGRVEPEGAERERAGRQPQRPRRAVGKGTKRRRVVPAGDPVRAAGDANEGVK